MSCILRDVIPTKDYNMNAMPIVSYLSHLSKDDLQQIRNRLDSTLADKVISMFNFYKDYDKYELRILASDIAVDRRELEYMKHVTIPEFETLMKRRCVDKMVPLLEEVVDNRVKLVDQMGQQVYTSRLHVLVKHE